MRKPKYRLRLDDFERRLLLNALLEFRNKALANGIDTVDIDCIIAQLCGKRVG